MKIELEESKETIITTKYAVLAAESYNSLNDTIGDIYGFPLFGTSYYSNPTPKSNWDEKYYMEITPDVQKNHAVCLEGIELVDSIPIEPVEQEVVL